MFMRPKRVGVPPPPTTSSSQLPRPQAASTSKIDITSKGIHVNGSSGSNRDRENSDAASISDNIKLPWEDRNMDTRTLLEISPRILAHLTGQVNVQLQEDLRTLELVVQTIQTILPKLSTLSTTTSLRKVDNGEFMNDFVKAHEILEQALTKVQALKAEFEGEQARRGVPAAM